MHELSMQNKKPNIKLIILDFLFYISYKLINLFYELIIMYNLHKLII